MITIVWTAIGLGLGAAVLHGTLGLRRPLDRTYLSFACIMAFIVVLLYFEQALYRASTNDEAIEAVRRQVMAAQACMACYLVFVPSYLQIRLSRVFVGVFGGALAILFVVNLVAPYGLYFSKQPEVVWSRFRGEPYTVTVEPPLGLAQYAYLVCYMSLVIAGMVYGIKAYRRGDRQRGLVLVFALSVVFVFNIFDIVRESVGGSWPYVAEYGFVGFGLIMSVQLARDFRRQADRLATAITQVEHQAERLTSIVDALHALERNMNAPLERLETGIATLSTTPPPGRDQSARLQRAVTRLREFSRSMPEVPASNRPA